MRRRGGTAVGGVECKSAGSIAAENQIQRALIGQGIPDSAARGGGCHGHVQGAHRQSVQRRVAAPQVHGATDQIKRTIRVKLPFHSFVSFG